MPGWVGSLIYAFAVIVAASLLHVAVFRLLKTRRGATLARLAILTLAIRLLMTVLDDSALLGPQHTITSQATKSAVNGLLSLWILTMMLRLLEPFFFSRLLPSDKRGEVPGIFKDIVRVFLIALVVMFVLKTGFGVELGALLTTSAILSAVVGFALQDTLGNILAGIAIFVEKPFEVGDWIEIGEQEGMVDHMSWRATRIWTRDNDYVVIPNSVLANGRIINFCKPRQLHREHFKIGVSYSSPPNKVKSVLLKAVEDSIKHGVSRKPDPEVLLLSYDDFSIEYDVRFWIKDYKKKDNIQDSVRARIWYYFRRHGIEIPFPIRNVNLRTVSAEAEEERKRTEEKGLRRALGRVPILEALGEQDMESLMEEIEVLNFATGEDLVKQGDPGESFFIILKGNMSVVIVDDTGQEHEVGALGKHDYFGEMSLVTGERRNATVRCVEDCSVAVVDREAFRHVMQANEKVFEALTDIVHERIEMNRAKLASSGKRQEELPPKRDKGWVRSTMQSLFGIGLLRGLTQKSSDGIVAEKANWEGMS